MGHPHRQSRIKAAAWLVAIAAACFSLWVLGMVLVALHCHIVRSMPEAMIGFSVYWTLVVVIFWGCSARAILRGGR